MGKYFVEIDLVFDMGNNPDGTAGISAGFHIKTKQTFSERLFWVGTRLLILRNSGGSFLVSRRPSSPDMGQSTARNGLSL